MKGTGKQAEEFIKGRVGAWHPPVQLLQLWLGALESLELPDLLILKKNQGNRFLHKIPQLLHVIS